MKENKIIYSLWGLTCFLFLLPISIYFIENGIDSFDTVCTLDSHYETVEWIGPYGFNRYYLINTTYLIDKLYTGKIKSYYLIDLEEIECYGTATDEYLYLGHMSSASYIVGGIIMVLEGIILTLIVINNF